MWLSALLARWSGGCWNEALRPRAAGKAPFGDLRSFPRTVTSDGRYQVQPVGLSLRSHVLVYATSQFGLLAEVARSHRERKESLQWHATQPYPAAAEVADKSARWNLPWRRYPSTCGASKKWRRMKFFASSPALFAAFDSRFLRAWSPTWRSPPRVRRVSAVVFGLRVQRTGSWRPRQGLGTGVRILILRLCRKSTLWRITWMSSSWWIPGPSHSQLAESGT